MSDYADHWLSLIEGAIGYIAPDSQNGKKLRPVLEQIRKEAQDMASAHMLQALENGQAALLNRANADRYMWARNNAHTVGWISEAGARLFLDMDIDKDVRLRLDETVDAECGCQGAGDKEVERLARWLCEQDEGLPDSAMGIYDGGPYREAPLWTRYEPEAREALAAIRGDA